jgi:APA family basic amino acid/polyamine antiporter
MNTTTESGNHLLRVLGVAFGIAAVIGTTIGQGILRSPGLIANAVGSPTVILLLWVAGGLVAMIDAMSTVELAASIRRAGGPYAFTRRAFGAGVGIAVGLADWLGYVGVGAFIAVVFAEYLHRLGIATSLPVGAIAVVLIAVLVSIQLAGTRVAGRTQEVGSAIKALAFALLIGALLLAPRGAPVVGPMPSGASLTLVGVIIAIRGVVGTYLGWNAASYFVEEVTDPRRQIARATFSGIALVMAIYVLVNVALLHVLTPAEMAGSPLAVGDAAARVFGPVADRLVTAISLVAVVTILNMGLMAFPRVLYAVARDAGVPYLSRVAANGTPRVAVILMGVCAGTLAAVGGYAVLLAFATWLTTGVAVAVNLAAIVVRRREPALERPWRMPLFPLPAIFSLLVNTALLAAFLYGAPATSVQATALLAVATLAVLGAMRWSAGSGRRAYPGVE